ncbi:iron complex transport system permease protein [Halanaerobium saccharolyticum]|jgi:iron complex transport system permease protein|uniref:Iron complex transport system permease protein n=1 Tax=Halanaerobium saccharolyticum TaxID=43595 RepID=A0A4R7Z8V8_9FIRM|nr:iron ABC transporter permease [Halanaerobium saccharolyticum]RAK11846.1 iron complex transport system permease protein [Halanaerobium saccharolyticum]TDW07687.1 iron complex transport system permease protein [Halanaerobium saccharolyticum]TDX64608.1 iron complex transport system permease protein [Halanaerobium saccharolyticum]
MSGITAVKKIIISGILLITLIVISMLIGNYELGLNDLGLILSDIFQGDLQAVENNPDWSVLYYIRLPRILIVVLVGAALSISGAAYQNIFRNPLVSPDILGVSAGAGLGVALGLLYSSGSMFYVYLIAFITGTAAVALTYWLSQLADGKNTMFMVLAGIVVSSLANALISLLKYLADPMQNLPGIVFYLMGGFSRSGWQEFYLLLPVVIVSLAIILFLRWQLNIFSLGEKEAAALGVDTEKIKLIVIIFSTIMVAAATAAAGQVSWIGLVIPHITRFIVGSNYKYYLPASALLGGFSLLLMDNLARTISGAEIPISIITALIGAPFFAYLLITKKESGWS